MTLVPFNEMMRDASDGGYAVGYFESWNLESLLAVADAAEAVRSPVLLGFSGIDLPNPARTRPDPLPVYPAMGLEICRLLRVPAALVYNESPHYDSVLEAIRSGYSLVMYSERGISPELLEERVRMLVEEAHQIGAAVEGELSALPGLEGVHEPLEEDRQISDPESALDFIDATGVDAFAVNIGQMHLHGRRIVDLRLDRLESLREALPVPLVLHGATSISEGDLRKAVRLGIRKINLGSRLKQVYIEAIRGACRSIAVDYNPYEIVGSGLPADVLMQGRLALQETVEQFMVLFGSAGKG